MSALDADDDGVVFTIIVIIISGFPGGSDGKESTCNAADLGSIPGSGRSPGGENDNPLQYSCLGDPMDRGAWWATVHRVAELGTTERLTHARTALHCSMWAS